ncbi:FERM and PDZ domain-containing protein 1 [Pristis pectinata]|uniref:FERM and PDZ domain-containing protein 1 n=1 Tax=Pristis pectinata TaxID=685728 RepID=UPI00223E8735|nr:FERM and PDZ domain-containing protein 1 [Pristis pectinata]
MEEPEDNMVQVRKSHKVEQMVSKWLRLTRDSSQRNRATADGMSANTSQLNVPLKVTVKINKDPNLDHGFLLSKDTPICVKSVIAGGPGEGKLFPGDQVIKINNMPLDSISQEHIDNIIRECGNSITVTVLRNTSGPKSSFITDEKRARLKSNPVKVRFAEEVIVNGHTQGNSLLFMPNVLKVYLENGQTKAFRYEKNTTVKDIILTLKSKLSIRCIEYFALALKERYSVTKVYLLHDDEIIEQVVQNREPRDYKCLFRVCFLPRDPLVVLQDDPVTFDYLYLQSCNDVLQEKFAMEMKCSTAIRLAALQIQECILSSKQSQKFSMKYIEKDWGIENFVSPTLLHNMKEKDVRKAINYHLKNNHSLIAPGQKQLISSAQARLNYLNILGDLRTYGGKTFNATLMLQDRESFITLLVGAKYGISQIINSKLNIMNQLTNFNNIRKLELTFECNKVSMVTIYLEDMKSLTLLLESHHAKDLVCFIAGYHRLYVNSGDSIFTWPGNYQSQPITTEEGDETRGLSDSESSSDIDSLVDMSIHKLRNGFIQPLTEEDEDAKNSESEATDSDYMREDILEETSCSTGDVSDLNDETSQGGDTCETSYSADSLEELQMETSTGSISCLQSYDNTSEEDDKDSATRGRESEPVTKKHCAMESEISLPQLSVESLISNQSFSEYNNSDMVTSYSSDLSPSREHSTAESWDPYAEVVDGSDTQGNIFWDLTHHNMVTELPPIPSPVESTDDGDASGEFLIIPILDPPPGFRDSSSEDEFFDAAERFTTIESPDDAKFTGAGADLESTCMKEIEEKWNVQTSPSHYGTTMDTESTESIKDKSEEAKHTMNTKKGHFTPKDIYDVKPVLSQCYSNKAKDHMCCYDRENLVSGKQQSPTFSSVVSLETEAALLEPKPISPLKSISVCINKKAAPNLMEMEPDTMEIKSVTEAITVITPVSATRYPCDSDSKMGNAPKTDGSEQVESISKSFIDVKPPRTACSNTEWCSSPSEIILELGQLSLENPMEDKALFVTTASCTDEQKTLNTISMTGKDQNDIIIENNIVLEKANDKYGPWADLDQNGTGLRYTSCQADLKGNTCTCKEEFDNCDKGQSCYRESNSSAALQRHLMMSYGDQEDLPDMSVLEEEISDSRDSSMGDNKNKDAYPLDMNRLVLNLNRMSFKTFGMVKHLSSPTLEPKMEIFSVRSPNISNFHREHGKDNQSKAEQNSNQVESIVPPTQTNVDNFSATLPCPGDKDSSHKVSSETNKSKSLDELDISVTQKSSTLQSLCPSAKSNSLNEPEEELGLNVNSEKLVIPTNDATKQLSIGGKEACSCQMVYGNCFRALGIDANDENKEPESLTQLPSPRTTPPASGSPLPQGLTTFNKQGEETMAAKCYFGVPEGDTAVKHESLVLSQFKDKKYNMPNGFRLVQNDVVELLNILKECPRESHAEEDCLALPSLTRQKLYSECRKLMSACQKGVKVNQTPDEMILGVSESFQALSQLAETCFQLTTCLHCAKAHAEVASTLRKVVMTYRIFVQASEDACGKMSDDLSMKLLAEQCASISAGIFCLNQLFTSNSLPQ